MNMPERWVGRDAGPVVRPYALTGGRTAPQGLVVDLVSVVVVTGRPPTGRLAREHARLLELCRTPATPADLASDLDLPFRVVQILLSDLHAHGLIQEMPESRWTEQPDPRILMRVIDELRRI